MITFKDVSKSYDGGTSFAIKDLCLDIHTSELLVLLGSSGSGKSTILKMINRLIEPTSGSITINQKQNTDYDVTELRRSMGYVFQDIGLFPHMTIEDNITITLRLNQFSKASRQHHAKALLEQVNLDAKIFLKRYPHQLSGGQQQRIGIARALATEPKLLLMDEPFGALDALTRDEMQLELLRLKKKLNKTIVFVTHDIFEALRLADRIAIVNQGKIEQIASKHDLIKNPKTDFVKSLIEKPSQYIKEFEHYLEMEKEGSI